MDALPKAKSFVSILILIGLITGLSIFGQIKSAEMEMAPAISSDIIATDI